MSSTVKIILGVAALAVLLYVAFVGFVLILGGWDGADLGGGATTVGVLRLDGVVSAGEQDFFSGGGIEPVRTVDLLTDADMDDGLDAVVLRVNSPGGSPAASWEIYERVRTMSKPVIVSVADLTASGAYYFASAADAILAAPTSSVGSIGVILTATNLEGLYDKLGIEYTVLIKGEYKDIGNPARSLTAEERRILDQQLDEVYEQFIADVAQGRGLEPAEVRELANGLTYNGERALELGLVDEIGTYNDALDLAAERAGGSAEDYVVRVLGEDDYGLDLLSLFFGVEARHGLQELARELGNSIRAGLGAGDGLRVR